MTPNSYNASQAAEALGIDVFYLGCALRSEASSRFKIEADRVRGYERPNFGAARALLRAAEACETAWDDESEARSSPCTGDTTMNEICACGPEGHALCDCGHTDYWHSHSGAGDCEHDGECSCVAFAPWTNVDHFSDCDGEWPCSCVARPGGPVPEREG